MHLLCNSRGVAVDSPQVLHVRVAYVYGATGGRPVAGSWSGAGRARGGCMWLRLGHATRS